MFVVVACFGDIMPPFILPNDPWLSSEEYIKYLVKEEALLWIEREAAG